MVNKIAEANLKLIEERRLPVPRTIKIRYKNVECIEYPISDSTAIIFERLTTDECAIKYLENGYGNIVIMNFASRHKPGGGYLKNGKGQEEHLCKVAPSLWNSLSTHIKYPFEPDSILLTQNVRIMRDQDYELLDENKNYIVNVVSASAQNLKFETYDANLIRRILENVYLTVREFFPTTETLILGAWGCGAYQNDPYQIANVMDWINNKYGGLYKHIIYAIPDKYNMNKFKKVIKLYGSKLDEISEDDDSEDTDNGPPPIDYLSLQKKVPCKYSRQSNVKKQFVNRKDKHRAKMFYMNNYD